VNTRAKVTLMIAVDRHRRFQGVPVDHQLLRPLLKKVSELELVPVVHTNAESNMEAVWRLEQLALEFPEINFMAWRP
jgi:predicted TIM-barrel fold metal-dependent hydrolase